MCDNLPEIDGFRELYGRSVFHCPYCDGWEIRDQPIAIYGKGSRGLGLSLELTAWTRDLVLCTDGPAEIDTDGRARLERNGIAVREERVTALEGRDGISTASCPQRGRSRVARCSSRAAISAAELAIRLGCDFNDKGTVSPGNTNDAPLVSFAPRRVGARRG